MMSRKNDFIIVLMLLLLPNSVNFSQKREKKIKERVKTTEVKRAIEKSSE
jgi:hypothetical protein